ncbi:hypothetical protein QL285_026845 [Trifolium repens]|nr:hypothetical protein QL285_026845 [Trifolium repens]
MDHKSRQVVLGLRVYEVVADVNPVNFHQPEEALPAIPAPPLPAHPHAPPAIGPPAIHFDSISSFLTDQAFDTRDALLKWIREVADGLKFVMTGISMVFLVVLLVVKRPRQTQIRRKTYKSRKKHQDRVQDAKRREKAQKVKKMSIPWQHDVFHRATMEAACLPRNLKNKSEENLFIAARCTTSQHDGVTWRPS